MNECALAVFQHANNPYTVGMSEVVSDEELMLRYSAGKVAAFEVLYARHKAPVYRYLLRQTKRAARADELLQDVWVAIIKARDGYTPSAKFTTWLYTIARSKLIDHYRRERGFVLVTSTSEDDENLLDSIADTTQATPMDVVQGQRCVERLRVEIEQLPAAQREAFLMHEEGLNLEQIAEVTQTRAETVKSRIRYALDKLRTKLADCL